MKSLSRVRLFATPWTVAYQASASMGFSRQEYWSGLPFPSPGESSLPRDQTQVSRIGGRRFNLWANLGNLISGSSAFSKSNLNIWKFSVHVLLKPALKNFEHYFAGMWDECNCTAVWTLALPFFGIWMKTDLFLSCGHWIIQICWHIECSTFTASSLRTERAKWNYIISSSFVHSDAS